MTWPPLDRLSCFFSGGEPTLHPDLPELAQYAVRRGMRAVISTNGTLLTAQLAQILTGNRPIVCWH